MNLSLIAEIKSQGFNIFTSRKTIEIFINVNISEYDYKSIQGSSITEKINTVQNFLRDQEDISKSVKENPKLNIVIANGSSSLDYVEFLNKKYEVHVYDSKSISNEDYKKIDLVLFTGGEDVSPYKYGENVGKYTSFNESRDTLEIDVFNKFYGKCLMLGICRGSQLLTVLSNGHLIQHVEGHCKDHSISLYTGEDYNMTSSHHQMLYPFNLNKESYTILAHSKYFQSTTYLNGSNEEIELSDDFLEPEIVYYKNTNSLCIQGHPEYSHCDRRTSEVCLSLIDSYLKSFKTGFKKFKSDLSEEPSNIDIVQMDKEPWL